MSGAAATLIAADRPRANAELSVGTLIGALLGLFATDNLLLLHFFGLPLALTVGIAGAAGLTLAILGSKIAADLRPVSWRTFLFAFAISLLLFALGGEGRFFYANTDWEVRDAVLRDLATNPWPFAYALHGTGYFLRAPLGTYLLPAMFGDRAEIGLLVLNALRLALILTLGCYLFRSTRERLAVLAIVILFSGWDIVGTAINSALGQHLSWDHIEAWNHGYQFSSNVTLAFWVPQHAIAGWTCALTFLLWRKRIAPVGVFAASIPLVAIWSPLAMMGAVPFALFAAAEALRCRKFQKSDFILAAMGLAIAIPALLYLKIDASDVGMHFLPTHPLVWVSSILLEILPFSYPLLRERELVVDRPVNFIILASLMVMPLIQVGESADFQMRASIMPLALLSIAFAEWTFWLSTKRPIPTLAMVYALFAIFIGAATPMLEVHRALVKGPSPRPLCSLIGVWTKQDNMVVSYSTYLAPVSMLPRAIGPIPVTAGHLDPPKCWERNWSLPQGWHSRTKV